MAGHWTHIHVCALRHEMWWLVASVDVDRGNAFAAECIISCTHSLTMTCVQAASLGWLTTTFVLMIVYDCVCVYIYIYIYIYMLPSGALLPPVSDCTTSPEQSQTGSPPFVCGNLPVSDGNTCDDTPGCTGGYIGPGYAATCSNGAWTIDALTDSQITGCVPSEDVPGRRVGPVGSE
jgi:hypothetical protein